MSFFKLSKYLLLSVLLVICFKLNEAKSNVHKGIAAFESKNFNLAKENFCRMVNDGNFFSYVYLKYMNEKLHLKIPCYLKIEPKSIPEELQNISQTYFNASIIQMKTLENGHNKDLIWSMFNLVLRGNAHATVLLGQWIEEEKISIVSLQEVLSNQEKAKIINLKSFYIFSLNKMRLSKIIFNPELLIKVNELFFSDSSYNDIDFEKNCFKLIKFKNEIIQFSNAFKKNPNSVGLAAAIIAGISQNFHNKLLWYTLALESSLENENYRKQAIEFIFNHSWKIRPFIARYYANFYKSNGFPKLLDSSNDDTIFNYILMLFVGMGGDVELENGLKYLIPFQELPTLNSNFKFINDFLKPGQTKQGFFEAFQSNLKDDPSNPYLIPFFKSLIKYASGFFDVKTEECVKFVRELVTYFSLDENKNSVLYLPSIVQLGHYYYYGIGGDKNLKVAIQYYRKAANLGNLKAQELLIDAILHDKSKNFSESFDDIYDFIINFANQGSAEHQRLVWFLNDRKQIKNPNLEFAKPFLLKAVDQKFSYAQFDYAILLLSQMNEPDTVNINNTEDSFSEENYPFLYYLNLASQNGLSQAKFLLNQLTQFEQNYFIQVLKKLDPYLLKFLLVSEKKDQLKIRKIYFSNGSIKVEDSVENKKLKLDINHLKLSNKNETEDNKISSKSLLNDESNKSFESSNNQMNIDQTNYSPIQSNHHDETFISKVDDCSEDLLVLPDDIREEMDFWDEKYKEFREKKNNKKYQINKNEVINNKKSVSVKENFKLDRAKLSFEVNGFIDDVFGLGSISFIKYTNKNLKDFLKDLGCKISDVKGENSTQVLFSYQNQLIAKTSYHNPHENSDNRLNYGIRNKIREFLYSLGLGIN